MSKVEDYINQHTKHCTNISLVGGRYYDWLTPNDARKAVEIAKEDVIERLREKLPNLISDVSKYGYMPYNCPDEETDCVRTAKEFIETLKQEIVKVLKED